MTPLPITEHLNAEALADAVAEHLAEAIRAGVAARGEAWLALAGGSTPFAAYRRLAAMELPWSAVHLVASDERAVPADHEKRNERALAEAFAPAQGVSIHPLLPIDCAIGAAPELSTVEAALSSLHRQAFDAVLLGMGLDAHFASLFPAVTPPTALNAGHPAIAVTITPKPLPPEAPFPRVSLSLSRLVSARMLMLMITGENKRRVLEESREQSADLAPIHALLAAAPDLAVHWSP